jgi:hypothetical protein
VPVGLGNALTVNVVDADAALIARGHRTLQEVDAVVLAVDVERWASQLRLPCLCCVSISLSISLHFRLFSLRKHSVTPIL